MTTELQELLDQVAAIPAGDIEEPDLKVGPEHQVVGKIDDLKTQRIFTGYTRRVRELDHLHGAVRGPMAVTGIIPPAIEEKMMELQDEMDLLRQIFFYTIGKRWQLFGKPFINVHEGWLVSWSRSQTPSAAFPNLGSPAGGDDDDDDDTN